MTNQTIKNMKLMIIEMNKQAHKKHIGYRQLKTLSNSYQTLLRQLFKNTQLIKSIGDMNELEYQHTQLTKIKNHLEEQSIPDLLSSEDYVNAHHITTATTTLGNSLEDINDLLVRYIYPYHRKSVGIFGVSFPKASAKLGEIIKNTTKDDKILDHIHLPKEERFITKNISCFAVGYSENFRGHMLDKVYIDSNLNSKEISIVTSMIRDSGEVEYF